MSRFYKILQSGYVIDCDLDAMHFNPVVRTIPKWKAI
jgi:hypothetical protein